MFFVLRSAVCIGLIISALPGRPSAEPTDLNDLGHRVGFVATAALDSYCRNNPARCLRAAAVSAESAQVSDSKIGRKLRSSVPVSATRSDDRFSLGS